MKRSISIVLSIHDKEFLLEKVVRGILDHVSADARELIAVFDGCTDRSEEVFDRAVAGCRSALRIVKLHTPDVWEVRSNNAGLRRAESDYCCIIQDDMVVQEAHFDRRLRKPLEEFSDCFAVSAFQAHNDTLHKGDLWFTDIIGRGNPLGESRWRRKWRKRLRIPHREDAGRDLFGMRDVVNRGPLLLDHAVIEKAGYLDEAFAPLDMDDHDLCFRVLRDQGLRCGSYTVRYESRREWGGTRASERAHRIWRESHDKNKKLLLERHRDLITAPKRNEVRRLP